MRPWRLEICVEASRQVAGRPAGGERYQDHKSEPLTAGHWGSWKYPGEKAPRHDDLKTENHEHGNGRERRDEAGRVAHGGGNVRGGSCRPGTNIS